MVNYLNSNQLDKAIDVIEQELNCSENEMIVKAFKESPTFQEILSKNNGVVRDMTESYDFKNDKDIERYLKKQIENKEKNYDLGDEKLVHNRR